MPNDKKGNSYYTYLHPHFSISQLQTVWVPVRVEARFKARVWDSSSAEIVGSNPIDVSVRLVSVVCCQVEVQRTG